MFRPVFILTPLLFLHSLSFTALHSQTVIDPARAAEAVPRLPVNDQLSSAIQEASSGGLENENAFAPSTPGDSDIGQQLILKRNEDIDSFSVWLTSNAFWTDNAANVSAGELEDWFFVGGVMAAWQQRLGSSRFYADVYASQQWFMYDELSELDYEFGEGGAGFLVLIPELANSIFHAHYVYQRITQGIDEDALYQSHNVRMGLQKTHLINRLNSVNFGLSAILGLDTEPDLLQRHEYAAQLSYNFKITRSLLLNLVYRVTYYDYFNLEGRQDWYQNIGVALCWSPLKNLDVVLSYNFSLNDSNYDVFDYQTNLAGPGVSVKFKF